MGLFRGLLAPFRGAAFVARHGLWAHVLVPLAVNVVLALAAGKIAVDVVAARLHYDGLLQWVAVGVSALLLFILAQPIVSAPFVDLLTEKVERIVTGKVESVGFFRSVLLSVWHGVLKSLLYALSLGVTALLFLLTAVGSLVGTAMTAIFLAYDGFDYPLARRIGSFRGKWRYLLGHPGQTLGYATGASLLYLVPLAALVAPPFAAVGATLAVLDVEAAGAGREARAGAGAGASGQGP